MNLFEPGHSGNCDVMIYNTDSYVALMRARADGSLPDMGSALRLVDILRRHVVTARAHDGHVELLDVGCAAGHFFRTFIRNGIPLTKYWGVEIDPAMIAVALRVWKNEILEGNAGFVNADIMDFTPGQKFDFVICMNAFMYFPSPKAALERMIAATRKRLLIRSYFTDSNYRIIRAQTKSNHNKSEIEEIQAFDDEGNIRKFDLWNIYSFEYIEALVKTICPQARLEWLDDNNMVEAIAAEERLNIHKRGATQIISGYEVSYPFILPWKYLSLELDN